MGSVSMKAGVAYVLYKKSRSAFKDRDPSSAVVPIFVAFVTVYCRIDDILPNVGDQKSGGACAKCGSVAMEDCRWRAEPLTIGPTVLVPRPHMQTMTRQEMNTNFQQLTLANQGSFGPLGRFLQ